VFTHTFSTIEAKMLITIHYAARRNPNRIGQIRAEIVTRRDIYL